MTIIVVVTLIEGVDTHWKVVPLWLQRPTLARIFLLILLLVNAGVVAAVVVGFKIITTIGTFTATSAK